ncbi:MAG: hypothetical protein QM493_09720 [Sulfurovum sp.]
MRLLPFTLLLLIALGLSGCSNNGLSPTKYERPTTQKLGLYNQTMRKVGSGIRNDSRYNKIELDTPEKKAWFKKITYQLWDRQITKGQFIAMGLEKYPTHKYEFDFVIRGFAKY